MTAKKVFEFDDYKAFLRHHETLRSGFQKGFRSRLAETLGCQNAYVSQVLNSSSNFSLEQGYKVATYLGLEESARRYFLLLIDRARAGTRELRDHFSAEIFEMREKFLDLKTRVAVSRSLSSEQKTVYYSQWYYAAIHVAVTIPSLRDLTSIARTLNLDSELVRAGLVFLTSVELVREKSGKFFPGPTLLHLERDAPQTFNHHVNWRLAAINSLKNKDSRDIHYSTVSSLSEEDVEVLRSRFVEIIQDYVKTIEPSKEEALYGFNLDFFSLTNDRFYDRR